MITSKLPAVPTRAPSTGLSCRSGVAAPTLPTRATVRTGSTASSLSIRKVPSAEVPAAVPSGGAKRTTRLRASPGFRLKGRDSPSAGAALNRPLSTLKALTLSGPAPVLVTVSTLSMALPSSTVPKSIPAKVWIRPGSTAATPRPVTVTATGEPVLLSSVMVPVKSPSAPGAKPTDTACGVVPGATSKLAGGNTLKGAPLACTSLTERVEPPVLLTARVRLALVPTSTSPKSRLAGVTASTGSGASLTVRVKDCDRERPEPSVTVTVTPG